MFQGHQLLWPAFTIFIILVDINDATRSHKLPISALARPCVQGFEDSFTLGSFHLKFFLLTHELVQKDTLGDF